MALVLVERKLLFSPPLCSFCQQFITSELDRTKAQVDNILYPERDRLSRKRAKNHCEDCGLCDYAICNLELSGLKWKDGENAWSLRAVL
jgi:hypothetical protein